MQASDAGYIGKTDSDFDVLLKEVIALDKRKIWYRLRSKHAQYRKERKPVIPQLARACETLRRAPGENLDLQMIRAAVMRMQESFAKLEGMTRIQAENHDGMKLLGVLVKEAHELCMRDSLKLFICSLFDVEEARKSSMVMAIQKLGRYYGVCLFLMAAAKRPLFRKINIEAPYAQWPCTRQPNGRNYQASLLTTLARVMPPPPSTSTALIQAIEIRSGRSFKAIEDVFSTMLKERHPVHAEIQLLYFYELNHVPRRPRVIASGKSACFLCNLFINMHGNFHTPRTHGVLYHHWSLPGEETLALFPEQKRGKIEELMHCFSLAIETIVQSKISASKTVQRHPNESVVFFAPVWSTSSLALEPKPVGGVRAKSGELHEHAQNVEVVTENSHQPSINRNTVMSGRRNLTSTEASEASSAPRVPVQANTQTGTIQETSKESSCVDRQSTSVSSSAHTSPSKQSSLPLEVKSNELLVGSEALITPRTPSSLNRKDSNMGQESSYKVIAPGETIIEELSTSGHALRLSTKHIHITLTTDEIMEMVSQNGARPPTGLRLPGYPCSVSAKVTYLSGQGDSSGNLPINVQDLRFDQPTTVHSGAALTSKELYLSCKTDIVRIKYAVG